MHSNERCFHFQNRLEKASGECLILSAAKMFKDIFQELRRTVESIFRLKSVFHFTES